MAAMLIHPQIDPVALQIGPLAVHWYGLTYLVAFGLFLFLGSRRVKHQPYAAMTGAAAWSYKDVEDFLFMGVMGVVLGGRIGYCLFYKPGYYASHPLEVFFVWQGGMSFHGGMLGVAIATTLFCRRQKIPLLGFADRIAVVAPVGLGLGRIANFANGELWGREAPAGLPWAMKFASGGDVLRHPSQLYQAALEGAVLLAVMVWLSRSDAVRGRAGLLTGVFLAGYAVARIIGEFFRQPDPFLGFLFAGATMGQLLSLPMLAIGVFLIARAKPAA
jgi:phosphatidylglycerol:prolipoprotein diacylglycerol transferase